MSTAENVSRFPSSVLAVLVIAAIGGLGGCDDTPTTAVVENGFPAARDAGAGAPTTVYKLWWVTTLFPSPVPAGTTSEAERTIPGDAFAYALLAPGWTPGDGGRPQRLIAVRSAAKTFVAVHDVLHIVVSDETFIGDCAHGGTLEADDARLIEQIFPGDFAGRTYDPATCATAAAPADASDASTDDALDLDTSAAAGAGAADAGSRI